MIIDKITGALKRDYLFIILITVLILIFYDGTAILRQLPIGLHNWKQSLHFSMVQNLADGSATFWHPAINNLFNINHTGKLILEFPLFHQLAAWLMIIFPGLTPVCFRWIMMALTIIGLYHIYRLGLILCKNKITATILSLLILAIPLVVFYGGNYLVDVPALLFSFSSIYFLEKNNISYSWKNLVAASLFFCLAGLLRLPVLIPFLAYVFVRILNKKQLADFIWFIPSVIIIIAWYKYVSVYNTYYVSYPPSDTYYFISSEQINSVYKELYDFMIPQFGWGYRTLYFYIITGVLLIVRWKYVSRFWILTLAVNMVGSFAYFYLWFGLFNQHDYYLIPLISNIVLIWLNLFFAYKDFRFSYVLTALAGVFLILNILTSYNNVRERTFRKYDKRFCFLEGEKVNGLWDYLAWDNYNHFGVVRKISPYQGNDFLQKHGIHKNDTVICDFDPSPTYVLSLLELKGWSGYSRQYNSISVYQNCIDAGAKYLICNSLFPTPLDSLSAARLKTDTVFVLENLQCFDVSGLKGQK